MLLVLPALLMQTPLPQQSDAAPTLGFWKDKARIDRLTANINSGNLPMQLASNGMTGYGTHLMIETANDAQRKASVAQAEVEDARASLASTAPTTTSSSSSSSSSGIAAQSTSSALPVRRRMKSRPASVAKVPAGGASRAAAAPVRGATSGTATSGIATPSATPGTSTPGAASSGATTSGAATGDSSTNELSLGGGSPGARPIAHSGDNVSQPNGPRPQGHHPLAAPADQPAQQPQPHNINFDRPFGPRPVSPHAVTDSDNSPSEHTGSQALGDTTAETHPAEPAESSVDPTLGTSKANLANALGTMANSFINIGVVAPNTWSGHEAKMAREKQNAADAASSSIASASSSKSAAMTSSTSLSSTSHAAGPTSVP
ncbi:hypothetical protein BDZ90DRAFT_267795 [Jaminaea rosea]|uniref:Uncharacterized protein n=1 Tax=Jaminaea rosea TaxID=1569628 RepID=A0A316UPS4_9BASI|nr:hypothetical protein BDZ90DRAFT_267795 [Jaminaea rosea]PWN25873.1 hypothetical protein BDZ90DRAFT_267795 [Jaminaea rosea]